MEFKIVKRVLDFVKPFAKSAVVFSKEHAPEIYTGLAIGGVVINTIVSAKCAIKAEHILESYEGHDDIPVKDKVKDLAPVALPVALSAGSTIFFIWASNRASAKKLSAAMTACGAAVKLSDELQEKILAMTDEEKEEIKEKIIDKKLSENPLAEQNSIIKTNDGTVLCFDTWSGRYFWSDPTFIKEQAVDFYEKFLHDPFSEKTLNELYSKWHLESIPLGQYMGWDNTCGHKLNLVFKSKLTSGNVPVTVIDYDCYSLFDTRSW